MVTSATAPGEPSASATKSATEPADGKPSPSPDYAINTVASAAPGGSAAQVEAPCDGGTGNLRSYPERDGVAATVTLSHTVHPQWHVLTAITPLRDPGGEETGPVYAARGGILVVRGSNLAKSAYVPGVRHAWPQGVGVGISTKVPGAADCDMSVYLNADRASAGSWDLEVDIDRHSGTVKVDDAKPPVNGRWQVAVTVLSRDGATETRSQTVAAKTPAWLGGAGIVAANVTGFDNLQDFTKVSVTVSKHGQHRNWLTFTRTP